MIPFFDLAAQQAVIKSQIDENIAKVLAHGKYILGPEVSELEERLCEYTGAKYCITCANGTDALQIALMAIGVGPGDEVITPAFSYIATAEATALVGATPIYVDVDPITFNINPALIEEKITARTKAIVPASLYGHPADFQKINGIGRKHNLIVIEDGAQSFGATQNGQKSCNLSNIGCTSFFPTKPLGCYGDGGAIFTSDEILARDVRQIARHGQSKRYYHERVGVNSRLDTIQAAVLLAKLEILDTEIDARAQLAAVYNERLSDIHDLSLPTISAPNKSAWAQFTIQSVLRSALQDKLKANSVPSTIHYPLALHQQPAVKADQTDLRVSEELAKTVLSLPFHAYMSDYAVDLICDTVIQFYQENKHV
jgi:UDP-2-acetamido-2-deoxy-ribo-hexuluronate aminotransferase